MTIRAMLLVACVILIGPIAGAAQTGAVVHDASPQILVLFSDDSSQPWIHAMTDAMNRVVDPATGNAPAWYFEYLDAVRFQDAERATEFRTALQEKYRDRP